MFSSLQTDIVFSLRQLRRAPGFALTAIFTLALGIGATTAVYSLVDGVLLRPLDAPHPEQLMAVHTVEADSTTGSWWQDTSWPDYLDWKARNHTFSGLAAYYSDFRLVSRTRGQGGAVIPINRISSNYFSVLRVQPMTGRDLVADDEQPGHHVALISYAFWQREFGGDVHVVGQAILISDDPYTVVGVMPKGFVDPCDDEAQVWSSASWLFEGAAPRAELRDHDIAQVVGRLNTGMTVQQAEADLSAIQRSLAETFPEIRHDTAVGIRPQLEEVSADFRTALLLLMASVFAVLLIVCTNVAGLMLTRAMRRSGEVALRTALGASGVRIWRQLLIESLALGACGGLMGAALATLLLHLALPLIPAQIPRIGQVGIDLRVLCFAAGISLACAVLSSLWPAWRLTRITPLDALREQGRHTTAGRRSRWFHSLLVVVQTTVGVSLLIASGFLIRGFFNLRNAKTGFAIEHLFEFQLPLTETRYPDARRPAFYDALIAKLKVIPGVRSVSAGHPLPLQGSGDWAGMEIDGKPNAPDTAVGALVGVAQPGFYETLGVPLLRGRFFTDSDNNPAARFVAIVNAAFVKEYFPHEDPIGQHIRPDVRELRNQSTNIDPTGDNDREIIGVAGDTQQDSLVDPPEPAILLPYAQATALMRPVLIMRVTGDPMRFQNAAQAALTSLDPGLFLLGPRSMEIQLERATSAQQFETTMIGGFTAIALFLSGLGLYSMLATMVAGRTREIGLRMAIGAARKDVAWLVAGHAAGLLLTGVVVGALIAAIGLRVVNADDKMHSLLFGVRWTDPRTPGAIAMVLLLVGLSGCLLPTWRAVRVEPSRALRDE